MAAPQRIVQLLYGQPRRAVDAQVQQHLLAPQRPAFVKDRMGKQPPPAARMMIRRHELQVMARVAFVGAGKGQTEMLLLLGELPGPRALGGAQVVHPEHPALGLHECARLLVGSRGNHRAQKLRHRLDLEHVPFRERHRAGPAEALGDALRFPLVKLQQRFVGSPLRTRLGDDLFRRTVAAKTRAGGLKQLAHALHFAQRKGFHLAERVIQTEFIPHPALQGRSPNSEGASRRQRTLLHLLPVSLHGLPGCTDQRRIARLRRGRLEQFPYSFKQRHATRHRLLHHQLAETEPILDYHCHLSPRDIAENREFKDLFDIWLEGDHYKWRAMRFNGVAERYCTGAAGPFEKFQAWAATVPHTVRNPLYHWTHLELKRYFGIDELLDEESAARIWKNANQQLARPELTAQGTLKRFNVESLCTTDDPVDDLDRKSVV